MAASEGVEPIDNGLTKGVGRSDAPDFSAVSSQRLPWLFGVINMCWPALEWLCWHSNLLNTLVSLSKHLPFISLPFAWSKMRLGVILVQLHWVVASSRTGDQVELQDSCYSWGLPPPRWFGGSGESLSGFGDCCLLRSRNCKGLLCSSSRHITKSNSSGIVAS
jgi:hypothetical protein